VWSSIRVAGFSLSSLVVVRHIRNGGPVELSVHIFEVRGRRMLVALVCSCCSYVRSGGQRYAVMLSVFLPVVRSSSWAAALNRSRYTTPVHATPPTHPPQIPSVGTLVRVGVGQGLFLVLAGVGIRIRYRWSWQRGGGDVLSC